MATLPDALVTRHRITVDDYHQMAAVGIIGPEARVELVAGEILDMSPIGSLHAALVRALARRLAEAAGNRAIVAVGDPLHLDDASEPQPDLALLAPRGDWYAAAHPRPADVLLVVEVAESSLAYDLGVKVPLYGRHGIPEAWVIDARTRTAHVFREPSAEGYARRLDVPADGVLASLAFPADVLSIGALVPLRSGS
ncbi:MAG: Uma2 family endonuclease [Planctomycetes bacterium]|nr:Uma2 family endonuclease [Planctomycetota bacterium]